MRPCFPCDSAPPGPHRSHSRDFVVPSRLSIVHHFSPTLPCHDFLSEQGDIKPMESHRGLELYPPLS